MDDDSFGAQRSTISAGGGEGRHLSAAHRRTIPAQIPTWHFAHGAAVIQTFAHVNSSIGCVEIFLTYKYGSSRSIVEAGAFHLPRLRWLGFLPSEAQKLPIPSNQFSEKDRKRIERIAQRTNGHGEEERSLFNYELSVMLNSSQKLELEALCSINYLSTVYLDNKLLPLNVSVAQPYDGNNNVERDQNGGDQSDDFGIDLNDQDDDFGGDQQGAFGSDYDFGGDQNDDFGSDWNDECRGDQNDDFGDDQKGAFGSDHDFGRAAPLNGTEKRDYLVNSLCPLPNSTNLPTSTSKLAALCLNLARAPIPHPTDKANPGEYQFWLKLVQVSIGIAAVCVAIGVLDILEHLCRRQMNTLSPNFIFSV
uniref:Topoisomerase 6 subunit A/Spo11 TOPRIM domain-containing protein n=1 Tax=Globodera rostochiensis TaxID=31243 RepID=A0A914IAE6_GLORO